MSGCAHCVYDIYLEDVQLYHEHLAHARTALLAQGDIPPNEWPEELGVQPKTGEGDGQGEDPKKMAARALEESYKKLDPAMRAFLEMEARLKKKQLDAG